MQIIYTISLTFNLIAVSTNNVFRQEGIELNSIMYSIIIN